MAKSDQKQKAEHRLQTAQQPQHTTWVKHHTKRNAAITGMIVAALVIIIVIASLPHPTVKVGQQAPDFTLQDINSTTSFHLSDYLGRPMMIEFMRTGCEYCQQEAPILSQLFPNYTSIVFVSITIDPNADQPNVLQSFAVQHASTGSATHPWYWLRDDSSNSVTSRYGINGTPTMFMIDIHGIVQDRIDGAKDMQTMQQAFRTIA